MELEKAAKFAGGMSLAFLTFMGLAIYSDIARRTEEFSPLKQIGAEINWQSSYNELFGKDGLADTNKDGALSFEEKVSLYRLMGYTNNYFREGSEGPQNFPAPTTSELEKAIKNYWEIKNGN